MKLLLIISLLLVGNPSSVVCPGETRSGVQDGGIPHGFAKTRPVVDC